MAKVIKATEASTGAWLRYERDMLRPAAGSDMPALAEAPDPDPPDVFEMAEEVLTEARAEAQRMVREAYAEGVQRGMEAGQAEFRKNVGAAAQVLEVAATEVRRARETFLASLETQVVELAHAIAARILHREASSDPEVALRTAREALAHLADRERVTLRVNPRDLDALRAEQVSILEEFDGVGDLRIVGDDSVAPGGCLAETERLLVDARLEAQLKNLLDAMSA